MAKTVQKVAQPTTKNVAPVAVVEAVQLELYEIPQSLPIQERSRNSVRRGLYSYLKANNLNGPASTPANPQSIALTKEQMVAVEKCTSALIETHFAEVDYPETEIALAVSQLTEKQALKCGGTITIEKLQKNTENFFVKKFAKPTHFPRK